MDKLAQCLDDIQQSHLFLSANKIELAKKHGQNAIKVAIELLKNKDHELVSLIRQVAQFASDYYEKLVIRKIGTLLFSEKVLWLSSNEHEYFWFPVLTMGSQSSMDIAPLSVDQTTLATPDFGSDFLIDFRNSESDWTSVGVDDLYQDLLPNCSFVLSLLLMADLGMGDQLKSLVRNFGDSKLKVRLHFNGTQREVAISLSLPYVEPPHEHRGLFVRSASNPQLLWPAYLEKAFLISLGQHYAFKGSNMAQDTYMLMGWFPEVRKASDWSSSELAELWRLRELGEVALGLGTGPVSETLMLKLGVISEHDYVLCAYDSQSGTMTLKNPWVQHGLHRSTDRMLQVGLSLVGQFSYMYINWKPNYQFKTEMTFVAKPTRIFPSYIGDHPQYDFHNLSPLSQTIAIVVEQFIGSEDPQFCVSVFKNDQGRILSEMQLPLAGGGSFTNTRVNYLKLEAEPLSTYTVVVKTVSQSTTKYTLTLHHNFSDLLFNKTKVKFPHAVEEIHGLWNFGYNGGNWATETYVDNPQYDIMIPESVSNMIIVLKADNQTNVSFHLLHCEADQVGKKLRNFDKSKLLFNERYEDGVLLKEVNDLEPGNYRLVVSSFDRENTGSFTLQIYNDGLAPLAPTQVPQALGTFTQNHQFQWNNSNRHKIWIVGEQSETRATFHFRANSCSSSPSAYRPALRASIFDSGTGQSIVVTEMWNDCIYGVFLDCTLPRPDHRYILLVERFETGAGICRISVGSSGRIHMGEVE